MSLPGILRETENEGLPAEHADADAGADAGADRPKSKKSKRNGPMLTVQLRDYQVESVQFMQAQENRDDSVTGGGVACLNGYFWEKRAFAGGGDSYW